MFASLMEKVARDRLGQADSEPQASL